MNLLAQDRRSKAVWLLLVAWCALAAQAGAANSWIDMGVKDDFAIDQPMVTLEVFEQLAGGGRGASLGPGTGGIFGFLFSGFFLDTGATSIIALNDAAASLEDNGYLTEGTVLEQGVAGFTELGVSAEYYLEVTDSSGAPLAMPYTRIMNGEVAGLDGVNGVVGMPAMVGKVVSLDTGHWEELAGLDPFDPDYLDKILELLPLQTQIADSLPAGNEHRYSVPITAREFHVIGDGPLPTEAPIPFLEMSVGNGDKSASGQFAVDTGASISFISTDIASAIGLDSNNDGVLNSQDEQYFDTLPIGGIGGTIDAPLFVIDRYSIPTEQGVDLVWSLEQSLSVLVVDIDPEIDGVFGAELITSGWLSLSEEEVDLGTLGPLQQTHIDFRQFFEDGDAGTLYFDLTPSFDVVQSATRSGDYNGDGTINAADYTVWRDAMAAGSASLTNDPTPGVVDESDFVYWRAHFGETFSAGGLLGDYNGDSTVNAADYTAWRDAMTTSSTSLLNDPTPGVVDESDFLYWRAHFGDTLGGGAGASSGAVPEPTSLAMLLAAAAMTFVCRRSLSVATRPVPCAASLRCASSWPN